MMKRNDFVDTTQADEGHETDNAASRQDLPLAIANIAISPESPVPIYEQICSIVRAAIVAGDLPPNTLLPTSRELAGMLGIGRTTAVNAYSRLIAEGYLISRLRRGTRVAPQQRAVLASVGETDERRTRILDIDEMAGIDDESGCEIEGALDSESRYDLRGIAHHAAGLPDMGGNCRLEVPQLATLVETRFRNRRPAEPFGEQPSKLCARTERRVGFLDREGLNCCR